MWKRRTSPLSVPPGLIDQWKATQADLAGRALVSPLAVVPRYVAGVDAAFADEVGKVVAAAVVYDVQARQIIETAQAVQPPKYPYVPTYLSFREGDAVAEAIGRLTTPVGVICFDGQGIAHPRRCGLATHMGVLLDRPAIGCAKSRLIGTYDEPGPRAGDSSPLMHRDEQIGLVLRTRDKCNPIFVSIGHRVDLPSATAVLLACLTKFRIPEPTRQADIEVARVKKILLAGEA
jgi:deoxyribonuclease V